MVKSPLDPAAMHVAPTVLTRALARARAEWLNGDPEAWARYTAGLAQLEEHYRQVQARDATSPDRAAAGQSFPRLRDRTPVRF